MGDIAHNTEEKSEENSLYLEPYKYSSAGHKNKEGKKVWRIILLSIAGLILVAYIGGFVYNCNYFAGYTEINGYDVSGCSVTAVENKFTDIMSDYTLDVEFKDGDEMIGVGDGSLNISLDKSVRTIKLEQNPLIWFLHLVHDDTYQVDYDVDYDEEQMKNLIDSFSYMQTENMTESVDAYVKMQDGEVVVVDEKSGTKLDKDSVYEIICTALSDMDSAVDVDAAGCYVTAIVKSDSDLIEKRVEKAQAFLDIDACIDIDSTHIKLTKQELSQMAFIDEGGQISISRNNVRAYAEDFAEKYNTSYSDRSFKTHDGETISVYGGYYGWEFDTEQMEEDLYNALAEKSDFEIEAPYYHRGYVYQDGDDIGDSYVEIDLSNQHVYVYMEGEMVHDADCVSGGVSSGHSTPGGLFGLTYKTKDTVLRGADYESAVSFWMPFNGGIGLHDASWRSVFGGDIYLTNGSHGCVNLEYSDAAAIYDYIETNFPIVCYWRE